MVASYLKGEVGEKQSDRIYGGMFITRLARLYRVLRPKIMGYLSVGGPCRIVRARSLKQMEVVMDLGNGPCAWYAVRPVAVGGDDTDEDDYQQPQH